MKFRQKHWRVWLTLFLFALVAGCGAPPAQQFKSTDVTGATWGKDFHLTDQSGRQRSLADFRGKVVLLFFGYTHCPDVCPTTLTKLAGVRASLGANAHALQVLFVTVDPKRDTAQRLAQYLTQFDPTFVGLWGNDLATAQTAKEFKVVYKSDDPETTEHSAGIYAFDTQGRLRLYIDPGTPSADIVHDVKLLLK